MRSPAAQSLFARTALLVAGTLTAFTLMAWAAIAWTTLIPAAEMTAHVLAQRTEAAIAAYQAGVAIPSDVTLEPLSVDPQRHRPRDFPYSLYLIHLRKQLQSELPGAEVVVVRTVMPTEVWIRPAQAPDHWFVLQWRMARPAAPLAMIGVLLAGALLVLVGAALFARRMTAPLADLAGASARIAEGEHVAIDTHSGPSEVRSLAVAFQSMSNRLAELDEQREIMLAGLSHELRSPLARVRVALELVEAPNVELAQEMATEIESIDRVVGQFLHYVRSGYHEPPIQASLDEIVRTTLEPLAEHVALELELKAPAPRWIAVESLRHILLNLVNNAAEYGRPPITVRTTQSERELQISVVDRGAGLSEEEWREAVQPFKRLRETPGMGHSGLGLALVERLVRVCRGTIMAARTGNGFVINVTLMVGDPGT